MPCTQEAHLGLIKGTQPANNNCQETAMRYLIIDRHQSLYEVEMHQAIQHDIYSIGLGKKIQDPLPESPIVKCYRK